MSADDLTVNDYPLAEKRPELVRGARGKRFEDVTLQALVEGSVSLEDLRITSQALRQQAAIARSAGRSTLAINFERAAELVSVPQDVIMRTYELLRPGRASSKEVLLSAAAELRDKFKATAMADFVAEAAEIYEKRGLFSRRY